MTTAQNPALPLELFDLRNLERYFAEGKLTQEQYDTFLAGLEDSSDLAEVSSVQMLSHRRVRRMETVSSEDES